MADLYVKMDEADFSNLVAGKEVTLTVKDQTIHLILADIGWVRMHAALVLAALGDKSPSN